MSFRDSFARFFDLNQNLLPNDAYSKLGQVLLKWGILNKVLQEEGGASLPAELSFEQPSSAEEWQLARELFEESTNEARVLYYTDRESFYSFITKTPIH